jgi:phosphoribosylamine--glycine ligase
MKVLVIGGGGREHALAWAMARSPQVSQVYVAPGNGGTEWPGNPAVRGLQPRAPSYNVPIMADDFDALVHFACAYEIDLTVVGPETPLAAGIVDIFQAAGLAIWGPRRAAALLEASKSFAKDFMRRCGIPTANYGVFDDYRAACDFVERFGRDVVVKADGLTAGKGVLICHSVEKAKDALHTVMVERVFGDAGKRVVVEERLTGPEISMLAFTDGKTVVPMPVARDHKRVYDGDEGPNTGGMGAYAPAPDIGRELIDEVNRTVLQPAVDGLAASGTPYVGVLYAGLMITPAGLRVLEFNCRFGDPETQVILPLLETDLYDICEACITGSLHDVDIRWRSETCVTIVLASPGYPGAYPTGLPISGLDRCAAHPDMMVFNAGTVRRGEQLFTAGGRVLAVTAIGPDLARALNQAYSGVERLAFEGMHYRRDIGKNYVPAGGVH